MSLFVVLSRFDSTENKLEPLAEDHLGLFQWCWSDGMGSCCPALYLQGMAHISDQWWTIDLTGADFRLIHADITLLHALTQTGMYWFRP